MRMRNGKHCKRASGRHRVFSILLMMLLVMAGLVPFAAGDGGVVHAAAAQSRQFELDLTGSIVYYGDWHTELMYFKFTDDGERERAYCMNPNLYAPKEGVHTAKIYNYKTVPSSYKPLWKALYYLEGGPGYAKVADVWDSVYHYVPGDPNAWKNGRSQAYALSHMVVSDLSPNGGNGNFYAGDKYIKLKNDMIRRINTMPDPPKTFQIAVYVSTSGLQDLSAYCAPLSVTGKVSLRKESSVSAVKDNPAYSLAGAVYGVYADAALSRLVAELRTDEKGNTKEVTLEEGTYYIREKTASPGYQLDPQTYTVNLAADQTKVVVSKEVPAKGQLTLLKSSAEPDYTGGNEQYSLADAEYTVYKKNDGGTLSGEVGKLITDETGKAKNALSLYAGTYYVKETKASRGFLADPAVYTAEVKAGSPQMIETVIRSSEQPDKGKLELQKKSANAQISADNRCYTLEGARYGIYRSREDAENEQNQVDVLVTDAAGNSEPVELCGGDYYVREIFAPKGYALDKTIYKTHVEIGRQMLVVSGEEPKSNPVDLLLEKTDSETGAKSPQGGATLSGALFAISYYDGYYQTAEEAKASGKPVRTWIFQTDEKGETRADQAHLVSGDPLFWDRQQQVVFPLGTVIFEEIKAPDGYQKNPSAFVSRITEEGSDTAVVKTFQSPVVPEKVKRGDLKGVKIFDRTAKRGKRIVFRLTSVTTGESHLLVCDQNGRFATAGDWAARGKNTNLNDAALRDDGTVDEALLDDASGIWFAGTAPSNGSIGAPAESARGALPYDEYILDELTTSANAGYVPLQDIHIRIRYDVQEMPARGLVDLGTLTNDEKPQPSIHTTAKDGTTGAHIGNAAGTVNVLDTVSYKGLTPGKTYTLHGMLMDGKTGLPVLENGEPAEASMTFTADKKRGRVEIPFTCQAEAVRGKRIVVFETLYEDDVEIASHRDLQDEAQSVIYPMISTSAGVKENGTIVDTVSYDGLIPGEQYVMKATLYDLAAKEMAAGKEGQAAFRAEKSKGHVEVSIDSKGLEGKTVVVYEVCTTPEGIVVGEHCDPSCEKQTVTIEKPDEPGEPEKPEKPQEPPKTHVPKTGDPSASYWMWIMLLSALAAAASLVFARRDHTSQRHE